MLYGSWLMIDIEARHAMPGEANWTSRGPITLCPEGWPRFPDVDACAGLYRLRLLDNAVYIGQTSNLQRRLGEYRRPTQGTEMEHVLHRLIVDAGGGSLDILTAPEFEDLRARRKAEQQAIDAARLAGTELLNPGSAQGSRIIAARIAYHVRQIEALSAQIAAIRHRGFPVAAGTQPDQP